jgi:hypothetical protein
MRWAPSNSDQRRVQRPDRIRVQLERPADDLSFHVDEPGSVRQVSLPRFDVHLELRLGRWRKRLVVQQVFRRVVERVIAVGVTEDRPPQRRPTARA